LKQYLTPFAPTLKDHELFSQPHVAEARIKLQRINSGIFEGKDEADKRNNAKSTLIAIVESIVPSPEPSDNPEDQPKQVDIPSDSIELLVDVGRAAAHLQFDDLATTVIEHCKNTKIVGSPTFRVKLDYLKCEVQAKELDSKDCITDDTPGVKASDPSAKKKVSTDAPRRPKWLGCHLLTLFPLSRPRHSPPRERSLPRSSMPAMLTPSASPVASRR
jgi:hypothetical protein